MKQWRARIASRYTIALALCAAFILLAIRFNHSPTVSFNPTRPQPIFDPLIDDVSIDTQTLKTAIASLEAKSAARFVFDPYLLRIIEQRGAKRDASDSPEVMRFQKVRLGVILSYLLDDWEPNLPVTCSLEGSTVTFSLAGTAQARVRRVYDLRAFTEDLKQLQDKAAIWNQTTAKRWPETRNGIGINFTSDLNPPTWTSIDFVAFLIGANDSEFSTAANWSGWALVDAAPEFHRKIEQTLNLWSNCKTGNQAPGEITLYRHGQLPEFTSHWNQTKENREAENRLNAVVVPWVKCVQTPLEKFVARIAKTSGTNIFVEWHSLMGGCAVGPNAPVTLDLQNVTAANALQAALDQCRQSGQRIGFVCVDGVVKVTVQSRLQLWTMRLYDVRDLIEYALTQHKRLAKTPRTAVLSLSTIRRVFVPDFEETTPAEEQASDALREILMDVAQETWPYSGQYHYFAGRYMISATPHDHQKISEALAAMRAKMK